MRVALSFCTHCKSLFFSLGDWRLLVRCTFHVTFSFYFALRPDKERRHLQSRLQRGKSHTRLRAIFRCAQSCFTTCFGPFSQSLCLHSDVKWGAKVSMYSRRAPLPSPLGHAPMELWRVMHKSFVKKKRQNLIYTFFPRFFNRTPTHIYILHSHLLARSFVTSRCTLYSPNSAALCLPVGGSDWSAVSSALGYYARHVWRLDLLVVILF